MRKGKGLEGGRVGGEGHTNHSPKARQKSRRASWASTPQTWSGSSGGSSRTPIPPTVAQRSGEAEEEEVELEEEDVEEEEEEETGGVLPIVDRDGDSTGERAAEEAVRERRSGREVERNRTRRIQARKEQKRVPK